MQIYEILSACDNVETMYHLNQYIFTTICRSSPNRFIIFILILSVLIGNINDRKKHTYNMHLNMEIEAGVCL